MKFKNLWDMESALQVIMDEGADSELWSEAVEWLIFFGPPEIQELLLDSSMNTLTEIFPNLKPSHVTVDGKPFYDDKTLCKELGITEEEFRVLLEKKMKALDLQKNWQTDKGNETIH